MTYLTADQWHTILMRHRKACQRIIARDGDLPVAQWEVLGRVTFLAQATAIDGHLRNRHGEVMPLGNLAEARDKVAIQIRAWMDYFAYKPTLCKMPSSWDMKHFNDLMSLLDELESMMESTSKAATEARIRKSMYDYLACRTPKHLPGECPECLGEGVVPTGRRLTGRGVNAWTDAPEYEYVTCDVCGGTGLDCSDNDKVEE